MNVNPTHVKMEELVLIIYMPILANVLGVLMVQPVLIVLHGILALCVKHLKAQVSYGIFLYYLS